MKWILEKLLSIFKIWIPLSVAVCGICLLVYWVVQQDMRQGAYDPQIQIAEDLASNLAQGVDPAQLVPSYNVDIGKSLATYAIVYDDSGKVLVSSALLDGKTPELPSGVLEYTRDHNQDRLSWQPKPGVRNAIIVNRYSGSKSGFILVGRSMREVEKRIIKTFLQTIMAGVTILGATFVATAALVFLPLVKRPKK